MRRFSLSELQKELCDKNIPQFCTQLKSQNGYDAVARKLRLNPTEQRLIDDSRRKNNNRNIKKA